MKVNTKVLGALVSLSAVCAPMGYASAKTEAGGSSQATKKDNPSQSFESTGRRKVVGLLAASVAVGAVEAVGRALSLPAGATKTADFAAVLATVGVVFNDSSFRDYACRVPLAYGSMKLVATDAAQSVVRTIPLGIGEALENMGEEGKMLETLCAYASGLLPAYSRVRDNTSVGRFIVHGETSK